MEFVWGLFVVVDIVDFFVWVGGFECDGGRVKVVDVDVEVVGGVDIGVGEIGVFEDLFVGVGWRFGGGVLVELKMFVVLLMDFILFLCCCFGL